MVILEVMFFSFMVGMFVGALLIARLVSKQEKEEHRKEN